VPDSRHKRVRRANLSRYFELHDIELSKGIL
jgi:hypothetical protein